LVWVTSLFFQDPAPTSFSPLSLHAALPIFGRGHAQRGVQVARVGHLLDDVAATNQFSADVELRDGRPLAVFLDALADLRVGQHRSEEHTSELQSRENLVCRLLLEKKNTQTT